MLYVLVRLPIKFCQGAWFGACHQHPNLEPPNYELDTIPLSYGLADSNLSTHPLLCQGIGVIKEGIVLRVVQESVGGDLGLLQPSFAGTDRSP